MEYFSLVFFLLFYFKFHDRIVYGSCSYRYTLLLFHSKDHRRGKGLIKYDYGRERERERGGGWRR